MQIVPRLWLCPRVWVPVRTLGEALQLVTGVAGDNEFVLREPRWKRADWIAALCATVTCCIALIRSETPVLEDHLSGTQVVASRTLHAATSARWGTHDVWLW